MDTNVDDKIYHQIQKNLSNNINEDLFTTGRVFEKENWLLGFSVFAIGEHGKDKNYLPGEESIKVINEWYKK